MPKQKLPSVLYVDDDPDICEVVKTTLCLVAGLDVRTAGSGEQAIDIAHKWRPDLVLMDVMMPGLDGPSTLKRMRSHALLAKIPVIFLTAKVLPAEMARLLQLGALGVIGKPFDPLKLCDDLFALWNKSVISHELGDLDDETATVRAQVDSLAESFLERTRKDVVRLRVIIERALQGGQSLLEEGKRVAHSIHGAGAMFGFPEISLTGGAMELLIEDLMSSAAAHPPARQAALLEQLLDLTDQLGQNLYTARLDAPRGTGMFTGEAEVGLGM